MTKYGVLRYSSMNIGDEIQSIAAMRFLPRIDTYIARERVDQLHCDEKVKLLMNAWWMWEADHFPPASSIEPLLISMHIRKESRPALAKKKVIDYLIKHGPVGCRDMSTMQFLNTLGVPAYFSGCLTSTLQRNDAIKKKDYILTVDVDEKVIQQIKKQTMRPVYNISRFINPCFNYMDRFKAAKLFLYLYQEAHCIVSPALHVAIPSLALQTPFLFLDIAEQKTERFVGIDDLLNKAVPDAEGKLNISYDFDTPPPNPDKYLKMRESLILKCKTFTGHDNPNSLIENIEPLPVLLDMLKMQESTRNRMLWFVKQRELLKVYLKRRFTSKNKHDLDY